MSLDNESRKAMIAYRQEKADIAIGGCSILSECQQVSLASKCRRL